MLELADSEMRTAARELLQIALSHGLYPRPWKRALMFTPPSNHLWCLLTIFFNEAETRLVGGFDAFAKFYSMPPDEVSERLNLPRATSIHVDSTRVRATALALDALMTSIAAKSESGLPS